MRRFGSSKSFSSVREPCWNCPAGKSYTVHVHVSGSSEVDHEGAFLTGTDPLSTLRFEFTFEDNPHYGQTVGSVTCYGTPNRYSIGVVFIFEPFGEVYGGNVGNIGMDSYGCPRAGTYVLELTGSLGNTAVMTVTLSSP